MGAGGCSGSTTPPVVTLKGKPGSEMVIKYDLFESGLVSRLTGKKITKITYDYRYFTERAEIL